MGRFAIKGLLSRKLRTALTAIAIVLGVAMISGTFAHVQRLRGRSYSSSKSSVETFTLSISG